MVKNLRFMEFTKFDFFAGFIIIILISISVYFHWKTKYVSSPNKENLGVQDLIEKVKTELIATERNRIDKGQSSLFLLKDFELEIKFVISETKNESGKLDFKVVTVGAESSYNNESVQTIKLRMLAIEPQEKEGILIVPQAQDVTERNLDSSSKNKKEN